MAVSELTGSTQRLCARPHLISALILNELRRRLAEAVQPFSGSIQEPAEEGRHSGLTPRKASACWGCVSAHTFLPNMDKVNKSFLLYIAFGISERNHINLKCVFSLTEFMWGMKMLHSAGRTGATSTMTSTQSFRKRRSKSRNGEMTEKGKRNTWQQPKRDREKERMRGNRQTTAKPVTLR